MNILVLAPQWPDPPRQGAAIRNFHILQHLARRHTVTLLTFRPEGEIEEARIKSLCLRAEALPLPTRSTAERLKTLMASPLPDMAWRLHSKPMRERVVELCRQDHFDAIHVEGIEMAPYGLLAQQIQNQKSKHKRPAFKIQDLKSNIESSMVYDAHNAEYLLQRRAFTTDAMRADRLPKAAYSLAQWWRLRRFEREICLASRHVLTVSEADAAALRRLVPSIAGRITLLPNGVDPAYWSRDAAYPRSDMPASDTLVFDGSMDFRPNVDAVTWFASQVWPLIRVERPGAQFFIVGRNPSPAVLSLRNAPGITVTGEVDDPRGWVAGAKVYVVPMRMGGGVRLKVLQAMAMGCAIVSTPMGAEGIDVRHGREMLIHRSAPDFARAILSLFADKERRDNLGNAARELAAARYSWEGLLPTLDRVYPISMA
ncbi:MAG TPA: glycosyltransferase family 4 protein [Chloroflexia bacterium]|jgi:glycosyltransferase involved in cell wall biosynthesis